MVVTYIYYKNTEPDPYKNNKYDCHMSLALFFYFNTTLTVLSYFGVFYVVG